MQWFDVDKEGLGKLLERRGKALSVLELIQNAFDEDSTEVKVTFEREPGSKFVQFSVEDNNPAGFKDITHAFTLFAESEKKADPTRRGRFNAGEKMVLALCKEARIITTTGTIVFDDAGRTRKSKGREAGSIFIGLMRMTTAEVEQAKEAIAKVIVPEHIELTVDGEVMPRRQPVAKISATLPTEVSDEEGILRRTARKTEVLIYPSIDGIGRIYEMGIPVVETGDQYDVSVCQKIPLSMERDNVTPSYLSKVRALTLEAMSKEIDSDTVNATWIKDAMESGSDLLSDTSVKRVFEAKFGNKVVAYDPSDAEANNIAVSEGYTVVHGRSLSKGEWDLARRVGALPAAGQVTPSPKPYDGVNFDPFGTPEQVISPDEYSEGMKWVNALTLTLGQRLMSKEVRFTIINNAQAAFLAMYGKGSITFNAGRLGKKWFDASNRQAVVDLIIHEFGHEYSGNHLSTDYYRALTRLGAKAVELALSEPDIFG